MLSLGVLLSGHCSRQVAHGLRLRPDMGLLRSYPICHLGDITVEDSTLIARPKSRCGDSQFQGVCNFGD